MRERWHRLRSIRLRGGGLLLQALILVCSVAASGGGDWPLLRR
ncbi:MAG: hypothetical protein ACRDGV_04525 [Candidatus Limnocylindria bacterium]